MTPSTLEGLAESLRHEGMPYTADQVEQAAATIGRLHARVEELEDALGVMVPTIIQAFLANLAPEAVVDRAGAEATLARIERVMQRRGGA